MASNNLTERTSHMALVLNWWNGLRVVVGEVLKCSSIEVSALEVSDVARWSHGVVTGEVG
jgi:hypothetical protein